MDALLQQCQVEWPVGMHQHFIPESDIHLVVNPENVRAELRICYPDLNSAAITHYTNRICHGALRLFAILLYSEKKGTIRAFIDDNIGDSDLPFVRPPGRDSDPIKLCVKAHRDCQKPDHSNCAIQAFSDTKVWTQRALTNFCRDQWVAQAPIFESSGLDGIPHYRFEDTVVLPYIEDYARACEDKGGYGMVWRIRVHAAHQKMYQSTDTQVNEPLLAIKQPFSKKPEPFQKERDMLSTLATKNHNHLIQLLATYEHQGSFHFMFPFANANLRMYWEETGIPHWNKETYLWCLRQVYGLASGLHNIHEFNATNSPTVSDPLDTARAKAAFGRFLAVEDGEEKFGRHGDIKPENILWFNELPQVGEEGILQITDMGLGRFKGMNSRSKVTAHFIGGSPTYMPPEVLLRKLASRAYDIWSMGCVFLEFITWLLEGATAVDAFTSARGETAYDGTNDDVYFTVRVEDNIKTATLREGVKMWISRLRQHERCSPMVSDLLNIVENRMLVVDSTNRIQSDKLVPILKDLQSKSERDDLHLLGRNVPSTDKDKGVKIPSGPKTLYANSRNISKQAIPSQEPQSSLPRASTHSIEIVLPEGHTDEMMADPTFTRAFAQESLPRTHYPTTMLEPSQRFSTLELNHKKRRHSTSSG